MRGAAASALVLPLLVLLLLVLSACGGEAPVPSTASGGGSSGGSTEDAGRCVDVYDPQTDYFPEKPRPRYAQGFQFEYFNNYKVVTVALPETTHRYVLVRCGTPTPEGVDGTVVEVPVERIVTTSTTELPHLVSLGLVDHLVGHDNANYVSSPEVRQRFADGQIREVGEGYGFNLEIVLELAPDLVMAASLASDANDTFKRLGEAGITVAHVPSFLENSPLGRAEWILLTASFFNREADAVRIFDEVAERYEELAALGRAGLEGGPTVLATGPTGDAWHLPGGESYMANLIADAGGRYLWADEASAGSLPMSSESVFERALDVDIWLHPSHWKSLEEIAGVDERLASFKAFETRKVFQNDRRHIVPEGEQYGANDYWETGSARPDLVLADFLKIFHPRLMARHEFYFHRQLPAR